MDERELLSSKFASEVESLQATQRREFRDWVSLNLKRTELPCIALAGDDSARGVQDEQPVAGPGAKIRVKFLPLFTGVYILLMLTSHSLFNVKLQAEVLSLQESFTITLGAQMKAMHNLR